MNAGRRPVLAGGRYVVMGLLQAAQALLRALDSTVGVRGHGQQNGQPKTAMCAPIRDQPALDLMQTAFHVAMSDEAATPENHSYSREE